MNSTNNNHSNLSREDINTYLSSNDEQSKRKIEEKALQDEFNNDSLEGWSSGSNSISDLRNLDAKFNTPHSWTSYFSALIFIVSISILLFLTSKKPESAKLISYEKTDLILPDSIDKLVTLPQNKAIQIDKITPKKIHSKEVNTRVKKELSKHEQPINQLPILQPKLSQHNKVIAKITAKEIYLNNFKIVDYRNYRVKPGIKVESIALTGLPADKESYVESNSQSNKSEIQISYYDYIKKTTLLLDRLEYKQVLARCNIILSHYPNDINALFYAGFCYYNLGEYNAATELFKECLASTFNNFDEEAEWMLAKSYEANGEFDKAEKLFKKIKERKNFYSSQI